MSGNKLWIGIIGLDTSHVREFTQLLNNHKQPYHVPGGEVVIAYPGGSADFEMSYSRVDEFTDLLCNQYEVRIVESPRSSS